jgi:hypothetical protein
MAKMKPTALRSQLLLAAWRGYMEDLRAGTTDPDEVVEASRYLCREVGRALLAGQHIPKAMRSHFGSALEQIGRGDDPRHALRLVRRPNRPSARAREDSALSYFEARRSEGATANRAMSDTARGFRYADDALSRALKAARKRRREFAGSQQSRKTLKGIESTQDLHRASISCALAKVGNKN